MARPLLFRKKTIYIKIETTAGTAETATLIKFLAFDVTMEPASEFNERRGTGNYLGFNHTGVHGDALGVCSFKTEFRGATTSYDTPVIAILASSGMYASDVDTYLFSNLISDQKTVTIIVNEDGRKKVLSGAMGKIKLTGEFNGKMMLECEYTGFLDTIADSPIATTDTASVACGTADAAVFPGQIVFTTPDEDQTVSISKFELDFGGQLVQRFNYFSIADRSPTITMNPEDCLIADLWDYYGDWKSRITEAFTFAFTSNSNTFTLTIPSAQLIEPKIADRDGLQVIEFKANLIEHATDSAAMIVRS